MADKELFIAGNFCLIKIPKCNADRIRPIDLKVFNLVSDGLSRAGRQTRSCGVMGGTDIGKCMNNLIR